MHPSYVDEVLEIKASSKLIFLQDDETHSDESSSIHSGPIDNGAVSKSRKSTKNASKSPPKPKGKFAAKFGKNKDELRERIMQEVVDKILPDIGNYNDSGYVPPPKEKKKRKYRDNMIRFLKFVGCLTLELHDAVLTGSERQVRLALHKLYDEKDPHPELINQYNQNGLTALSIATKINNADIVGILLENNAVPDYIDEATGRTPIFYSVLNGNHRVTKMFLSCNASVNMVDFQCMSPLMIAASKNDILHVRMLLAVGAEIDLQDDQGWTALHHAAANNAPEVILALLNEGADKRIRDLNHRRPVNLAKFKNFGNCIAALANRATLA